jgi:uracil-DNA glycosylase
MKKVELIILIGQYSQNYYLGDKAKENLTATAKAYEIFLPQYFPLPHPSPRNRFWLMQNKWFEKETVPLLQKIVKKIFKQ